MRSRSAVRLSLLSVLLLTLSTWSASADITFNLLFNDPGQRYSSYYSEITSSVRDAGSGWAKYLYSPVHSDVTIQVNFDSEQTASASSEKWVQVGQDGSKSVWEQGIAYTINTGQNPPLYDASAPDARLNIGTGYLQNELWFGPTTGVVPSDKMDATSVFTHEIGHMLAFNGWRNWTTGSLTTQYESTYDRYVVRGTDGYLYFTGPHAEAIYGGAVPLTYGNYAHVGNLYGPGSDLLTDLMDGVWSYPGTHEQISSLDLAILADSGVTPAAVPETRTIYGFMLLLCIGGLTVRSAARRSRP